MDKTIMGTPTTTPMKVPDWNQNDERKADYIKGRAFYTTYDEKTETKTVRWTAGDKEDKTISQFGLIPGNKYSVTAKCQAELVGYQTYQYELDTLVNYPEDGVIRLHTGENAEVLLRFDDDSFRNETRILRPLSKNYEFGNCTITINGTFANPVVRCLPVKYIKELSAFNFNENFLNKYLANKNDINEVYGKINELEDSISGSLSGSISGDAKLDISEIHYSDNGFEATFNTLLEKGMQLYYDYTANGKTVSGMAKPIKLNDNGKLEVSIGDKHHTDFALVGIADVGSNTMTFTFIENVNYTVDVKELSIPTPIPFKFLGLSEGINLGFNSEIKENSLNSNNFGSSNSIDGEHNNTFGTGHTIKGKASTAMGQNGTIEGNLDFLGGDRGNITGRCDFGYGTDIFMSGQNSGAVGYGLRSIGNNQFVIGKFNADDADALLIIGGGDNENSRQNTFVVKKDGNVYINNDKLIKLTQTDRDKLDSFTSNGSDNTNTGSSSVQLGFKNVNSRENVIQLGRENEATASAGGYIYQMGYGNKSLSGQTYLIGKKLVSSDYEQVVVGRFNEDVNNAIFVVGNGYSDTSRKNAMVIDKYNNVKFTGAIKASAITLVSPSGYEFDVAVRDDGTLHIT